tara:strand:+ start:4587 stop:5414 length:828 start_codon:yes stop_codon:yes gene_type:complete
MFRARFLVHRAVPAVGLATGLFAGSAACEGAPEGLFAQHKPTILRRPADVPTAEPPVVLEYFALQGLGELSRLVLEVTGTAYESVFHFGTGAYKKYAPFGQLPILHDGSNLICESGAIARHLARKACIDGSNLAEKAKVDMYFELSRDIVKEKAAAHDMDAESSAKLKGYLAIADKSCNGKTFVGDTLTFADVGMFHALHWMREQAPGSLTPYPNLDAFVSHFEAIPNVKAYLASPRRVPLTNNEMGKGHQGLPGYRFIAPLKRATYATPWEPPM